MAPPAMAATTLVAVRDVIKKATRFAFGTAIISGATHYYCKHFNHFPATKRIMNLKVDGASCGKVFSEVVETAICPAMW